MRQNYFFDGTEQNSIILKKIIMKRLEMRKNVVMAIVGKSGEGKSWAALRIAELIQPDFSPKEQIVYTPLEFLEKINYVINKYHAKVLILDEAHTTIPSKTWYSFANMAIHHVVTTFRQLKNIVLIIVTPTLADIDKSLRSAIDYYCVAARESRSGYLKGTFTRLMIYEVSYNFHDIDRSNPYIKKIKIRIRVGEKIPIYTIQELRIGTPSEHVIKEYEEMSSAYKKSLIERKLSLLNAKIEKELKMNEEKKKRGEDKSTKK